MPFFLKNREKDAKERMDDPHCDKQELFNTYEQFSVINALISRWRTIYINEIRAACTDPGTTYTLLDIGFGGGDLPIKLSGWAHNDGINLDITAIETDKRACEYVENIETPHEVSFRRVSSTSLREEGKTYDFVISNHLVHHLGEEELLQLLDESQALSRKKVLFNDIERSDTGYLLFNLLSRPIFQSSFITEDGLTSIRRSYMAEELRNKIPPGWEVTRIFPYRLLLSYEH